MKSIFRGSNYLEAQLLNGLLHQHGINAFLQGADLQGGLGEAPVIGYLSILVEIGDVSAATCLITAYERGELAIDDEWREADGNSAENATNDPRS